LNAIPITHSPSLQTISKTGFRPRWPRKITKTFSCGRHTSSRRHQVYLGHQGLPNGQHMPSRTHEVFLGHQGLSSGQHMPSRRHQVFLGHQGLSSGRHTPSRQHMPGVDDTRQVGDTRPATQALISCTSLRGCPACILLRKSVWLGRPLSSRVLGALPSSMIPFPGHIRGLHTPGDTPLKTGFITITIRIRELKLCNLPC
jgi:hypothetical protein